MRIEITGQVPLACNDYLGSAQAFLIVLTWSNGAFYTMLVPRLCSFVLFVLVKTGDDEDRAVCSGVVVAGAC